MVGGRVGADVEALADGPITQPLGEQPQHIDLPFRQTVRTRCQQRIHKFDNPGLANRSGDGAGLVGQASGFLGATLARRKQRVPGQRLRDMNHRTHPPIHLDRHAEMALGRGIVTAERGDPGEIAVGTSEERNELTGHEVLALIAGNERAQCVERFSVAVDANVRWTSGGTFLTDLAPFPLELPRPLAKRGSRQ